MAEEAKKGPLEQAAEGAVDGAREAVEGAVQGAREAVQEVQEALGGAIETAADVAIQTAAPSNLTGIAVVVLAALVCGMALERLRQPALVGYILAGVLLGPSALAVVESREQIDVLAELGVLMLLFIVGMELSLRSFRKIWGFALLVTGFQIGASVGVMLLLSMAFGWPTGLAVLLGFVVALSSTAVAIKILDGIGELRSRSGRIAVAVLIAQDLAVVPMMLGIGAAGGDGFDWIAAPKIALSVAFLVALILYLSRSRKISLPFAAMVAGNADLKPLAAVAFCVGCAAVTGLLGLSAAYGAFIAGLIIGNSRERHAMLEATRPIQSILMMVFFLSIGLLIDLDYIWSNFGTVLLLFLMVSVFKTALNVGFLGLIGQPWHHAFVAGIVLAQIGEFSFLLSVVGVEAGVISDEDRRLVVAVTVLSLALSPLWVVTGRRLGVLAKRGITSGTELLKLVYGPETEFVAMTLDKATSKTMVGLRAAALWLRRQREARKKGPAPGKKGKEAEIVLPGTPANEEKPGGKKGPTRRRRKDA
ncbi:MAG: cation/H(+) antiporter [Rhodospirillaceae bacterium]|jgi:CPA2 family monovalent cation:H+ antiporter-2|nr:cation/H(+) antiporter [Rhodospirillaceae bacterium]|tara:strand:- start:5318 stop:6916 length:1599 start_codon:yes stop_codon:yes gene_type:complete